MNTESIPTIGAGVELSSADIQEVINILEDYLQARELGHSPDLDALIADHPAQAELIRAYVDRLELLHQAAAGLRGPMTSAESAPTYSIPQGGRLGDFYIHREIGRGGMGIVYEAEQISLGRRVALKVLPFAAALDAKQLQRFRNESHSAANLHHTNIVPVHAVGADRGVHYYAMQFIEGQTLAALIAQLRDLEGKCMPDPMVAHDASSAPTLSALDRTVKYSAISPYGPEDAARRADYPTTPVTMRSTRDPVFFRTVAQLGVQAAEALEHAHQMGVIHRDIKPANLLVDAQLHLWVTDFGLALCQSEGGLTLTGDLVGTLRYMSPEQALAKRSLVDHRTDVYSLGVTLYELATLEPAYAGRDRHELLRQIAFDDPRPPRRVNPALPVELETIIQKAMTKEPESRYSTAQELADDLRRYLEHKPILARRPTVRDHVSKWMRRHRPMVAAVAGLLVLAVAGSIVGSALVWRAHQQMKIAFEKVNDQFLLTTAKQYEAQAARNRAEANFRKACSGVTGLLQRLEDRRWAEFPAITQLRRDLAEQGMQFLQSFLDEENPDPQVRQETGRACQLLASVYRLQNERQKATEAHAKAVALFEQLMKDHPNNAAHLYELALSHNIFGLTLHEFGQISRAADEFELAVVLYRQALERKSDDRVYNEFAWLLASCPQERFRQPAEAVALAQKAIQLCPYCGASWNTLGVAYYRVNNWQGAITALKKSIQLRRGGDCADWFFLAMAYWRLGDKQLAGKWCEKALKDVQKSIIGIEPTSRYREEAEALMGPGRPAAPTAKPDPPQSNSVNPAAQSPFAPRWPQDDSVLWPS